MNKLAFLIGAVAVTGANAILLSPVAPAIAVDLDVSLHRVLWGAAVYGLATLSSALLLARWAGKQGPAHSLRLALVLLAVSFLTAGSGPSITWFHAASAMAGIGTGVALPSAYALGRLVSPPGREARTMGLVLSGWTIALICGVSLAGYLADTIGWRWVYWGVGTVTAGLVLGGLRCDLPNPANKDTRLWRAWQQPGFSKALAVMGLLMLAFYTSYTFIGAHVVTRMGFGTTEAGLVVLAYGMGFGTSTFVDPLLDRIGAARVARPLFLITGAFYVGFGFAAHSFCALWVSTFLWGITQHLALNIAVGRLNALSDQHRAAVLGWNTAITYLAVFLGAIFGQYLFAAAGFQGLTLLSAALLAVMALLAKPQA